MKKQILNNLSTALFIFITIFWIWMAMKYFARENYITGIIFITTGIALTFSIGYFLINNLRNR